MDDVAKTLAVDSCMAADRKFSHSITRHLFEEGDQLGSDLVALNIQRGRDHGLPGYNAYREVCHMKPLKSLKQLFPDDITARSVYESIDDVDLFTGAMSEDLAPGALVGPTFACILSVQFNKLKYGDRFFYLNEKGFARFTEDQIKEIKKTKLSKIVCQNSDMEMVQENIFSPEDPKTNPLKKCREIRGVNLNPWAETDGGVGGSGGTPRK